MTVREYIGARYVPLFMGEWDDTVTYEPLSIVEYQGNSYTSRQYVPTGIEITNDAYWAETGSYNAQVEAYRQEVQTFNGRITANETAISNLEGIIPNSAFTSLNTVKDYIDAETTARETAISNLEDIIPDSAFTSSNTVKDYIDAETTARENADNALQESIDILEDSITSNSLDEVIEAAEPIMRFTYTTGAAGPSCIFDISGTDWFAYTTAQTTTEGVEAGCQLHIVNMLTKTQASEIVLNAVSGHANSMCYSDEKLYIVGSAVDPLLYIVDVSNPNLPTVESTISTQSFATRHNISDYWFSVMKIEDGFYIGHMESGQIWQTDNTLSNETLVCDVNVNRYTDGIPQFITYSSKHEAFIFIWSNRIEWYNTDGNMLKTQHFQYQYGFICTDEIESVCVIDDDVYFSNSVLPLSIGNILDTSIVKPYVHVSTLWHFNLKTGAQVGAHPKFQSGYIYVELSNTVDPLPLNSYAYDTGAIAARRIKLKYAQDLRAVAYLCQDMNMNIQVSTDFTDQIIVLYGTTYTNLGGHKLAGVYVNEGQHVVTGYRNSYVSSNIAEMALNGTSAGSKAIIRQEGGVVTLGDSGSAPTAEANKKILAQRFAATYMFLMDYDDGLSEVGTWGSIYPAGNHLSS